MNQHVIRKAVFPVAGLGTRFLPATKSNPKEMMPIVDKPLIQYAVEEAVASGITELIFVTSHTKRAIEDHFDASFELESRLREQGRIELLNLVQNILPSHVSCVYVRQPKALGLGHAVLCAKDVVGDEPFAVLLADDLIDTDKVPCLKQMMNLFEKEKGSVVAVQKVEDADVHRYGIVDPAQSLNAFSAIKRIIEKPSREQAPSNYGVVGRYILTPQIFHFLEQTQPNVGGEIQLTDAMDALLKSESMFALCFDGQRYDCGSKLGYLEATVNYALKHSEVADDFREFVKACLE